MVLGLSSFTAGPNPELYNINVIQIGTYFENKLIFCTFVSANPKIFRNE